MDQMKTGGLIRTLRRRKGLTALALAERLGVSDKAVFKWERGRGAPDISLLPALSEALGVDTKALLRGDLEENEMTNGNLKKMRFYDRPDSGNLLTEPVSGLPVIVADRALTEPVFVPLHGVTDGTSEPETARLARQHFRFVRFDTLRGGGLLPACQPESIASVDEPLRPAAELYVASCAELRDATGYDAIFPAAAFADRASDPSSVGGR